MYLHDWCRDADEERHGRRQIVYEVFWQHRDEDVLPVHWVQEGVGSLDARGQPRQASRRHNDAALEQHRGEDDQHVVYSHRIVILGQISLKVNEGLLTV